MNVVEVFDGAYHFPNVLTEYQQADFRRTYDDNLNRFYVPKLKSGHYMNLDMNCLGQHWSAVDYKYHDKRTDIDNEKVAEIPKHLLDYLRPISLKVFPYHNPDWDVCIINSYANNSTLGLHVDNSESEESLAIGHPVVSVSLGASCVFRMAGLYRKSEHRDIILNNGDVFIFGGKSRLRYHGVTKITGDQRINFTFRKL